MDMNERNRPSRTGSDRHPPTRRTRRSSAGRRGGVLTWVDESQRGPNRPEPPSARRSRPRARPRYGGRSAKNSGCPGSARARLRRLLSLRSQVESRRARTTSRSDPSPRKPRGVEAAQLHAGPSGGGFRGDLSPAPALASHLTHWRLSHPSSCRVHRPGHRSCALRPVWTRSAFCESHAALRARPGNGWPVAGCSWSVRKIRSVSA